jgi:O-antigen ligase
MKAETTVYNIIEPARRLGRKSSSRERDFQTGYHVKAGVLITLLVISIRVALTIDSGGAMIFPLFCVMATVAYLSPPLAGLFLLYGIALISMSEFSGFWVVPRLPIYSLLTVWTLLWMLIRRRIDKSYKFLMRPVVMIHLALILAFFGIGFVGALLSGNLSNPLVAFYNWDVFRGWIGFLVVGLFACRDLSDLKALLVALPFALLIYPLSIPLSSWQDFIGTGLSSSQILGVGLGYGSLNTNTLGQASAVASVVAMGAALTVRRARLSLLMFMLFGITGTLVFVTVSRQSIISLFLGLLFIIAVAGFRRGLLWLALLILLVSFGIQVVAGGLSGETGFQNRLLELTQNPETWRSHSFEIRLRDIEEATDTWLKAPWFGAGFGGQNYDVVATADRASGEYSFELRGTHNLFLGILAQTGICGLILFLCFWFNIVRRFLLLLRRLPVKLQGERKLPKVAILAAFSCIFVQQNISGGLGVGSSSLVFLLGALLGVLGAGIPAKSRNANVCRTACRAEREPRIS